MTIEAITYQGRHKWSDRISVPRDQTPSGCEQTERTCGLCKIVRITVHPPQGFPWREWRHPNSDVQFACEHTPPCKGSTKEETNDQQI